MRIYEELSDNQKYWIKKGLFAFVVLVNAVLLTLFLSYGSSAWKEIKELRKPALIIAVQGEGKVLVKPDVAKITATILTDNASLAQAQKENSERSKEVTDFLRKNGIDEKDIKTASYNIFPQYSYPIPCLPGSVCPLERDRPTIVGYQVRNTVSVTIRDSAKAGDILEGIIEAGVNEVSNFQFTIDDPEKARAEAREKAIADARSKAQALAKTLGKRLGRIANFSESGTFPQPIPALQFGGKGGDFGGPPSLQPGENEVVVQVNVNYEFK